MVIRKLINSRVNKDSRRYAMSKKRVVRLLTEVVSSLCRQGVEACSRMEVLMRKQ